jgi:hypothetical protein
MKLILAACAVALATAEHPIPQLPPIDQIADWQCIPVFENELHAGVTWKQRNCTVNPLMSTPSQSLVINSIHVDVTRSDIRVVPYAASKEAQLQSLPDIAGQNENFIAGINGGYFWRVDIDGHWRDNVCKGKQRFEAEQDADPAHPNYGIGDGVIRVDGVTVSNNCNCTGYSRPAVLQMGDPAKGSTAFSSIDVLHRGEAPIDSDTLPHAIGAGPNLISYNFTTGESYVDIPSDDDNINRVVYEATTAVGLVQTLENGALKTNEVIMVTTDGSDSCMPFERFCGLEANNLATLMRDVFKVQQAMSMDQGGSTTMFVKGANPSRSGVVSRSDNKQPEDSEGTGRHLANGLFVEVIV